VLSDAGDARLDGPDDTGRRPRCAQDRVQQEGRGGLAVRARDPCDAKRLTRVAEEPCRCERERGAGVVDEHDRHIQPKECSLSDDRYRSPCHGVRGELVPICGEPPDTEEDITRSHLEGAIRDASHNAVRPLRDGGDIFE